MSAALAASAAGRRVEAFSTTRAAVSARALADDSGRIDGELRHRRELLARSAETYLALADRLDDEIAGLEAARRSANPASDASFDELLDDAERWASEG